MNTSRWSEEKAKSWFNSVSNSSGFQWGVNFVPSTAVNQIDFWMEPFDAETVKREIGWAQTKLGMNIVRVHLHDLVYSNEGDHFLENVDQFLSICCSEDGANMKAILVLLESAYDPLPRYGPQSPPRRHVYNGRWVQSPGSQVLTNQTLYNKVVKDYVQAVVGRYATDSRVQLFDLWNEPFQANQDTYGSQGKLVRSAQSARATELTPQQKQEAVEGLLPLVFEWARQAGPDDRTIPLTASLNGNSNYQDLPGWKTVVDLCDVIAFHNDLDQHDLEKQILSLQDFNRPLICTQFLARSYPDGSLLETSLIMFQKYGVWAVANGLVVGKTQRHYPLNSWYTDYDFCPDIWHANLLHKHGHFFSSEEQNFLQDMFIVPTATSESMEIEIENGLAVEVGLMLIGLVVLALGVCVLAVQVALINFQLKGVSTKDTLNCSLNSKTKSAEKSNSKVETKVMSYKTQDSVLHASPPVDEVIVKRLDMRCDDVVEYKTGDEDYTLDPFLFSKSDRVDRMYSNRQAGLPKINRVRVNKIAGVKMSRRSDSASSSTRSKVIKFV